MSPSHPAREGHREAPVSPGTPDKLIADIIAAAPAVSGFAPGRPEDSAAASSGAGGPREPRALGFDLDRMNAQWAVVLIGSKAVIVQEQPSGKVEDRVRIVGVEAFRTWHLNKPTERRSADGRIATVTWADAWLKNAGRREYRGIEFWPDPDGAVGTPDYLNLWRGFAVTPRATPGAYSVFRDHLRTNVCGEDDDLFRWTFGWFAHLFQRPRERIGTALVLRGGMGTGKTKVGEVFGSLIPSHYFMVDEARYITGQFNAHMASCLLLQAEEAVWAGDKAAEGRLKSLVTSTTQMIEAKGVDPIRLENFVRLLMTSNENWVVPAGKDERRFCVLDVKPHVAQNGAYFAEMEAELAAGGREALLADLLAFDLDSVDLRRIPKTGALLEQKLRSLDSVDSWWFDRLHAGTTTRHGSAWLSEVPCTALIDDYVAAADRVGVRRKAEEATVGRQLAILIPGLRRGRRFVTTETEAGATIGKRLWYYVLPPLADCRSAFDAVLGQEVAWPVDDGESAS